MGSRFEGRRALVTGASRGIGAAIAQRLAAEGADVAITARTLTQHRSLAGSLEATAEKLSAFGGRVVVVTADMTDENDRQRIVPAAERGLGGAVDILVNNAAAAIYQPLRDYPLRRRRTLFEVNVHGPVDLAQAVIPGMVSAGEGWIVNVSSLTASLVPGPPFRHGGLAHVVGVYGASKASLNRLTNALAAELWGTGVRVNTIEPRAAVMTEGAEALVGDQLAPAIEPMETMVEATVALCDCAAERTGAIHSSLALLAELRVEVRSLDGSTVFTPAPDQA